MRQFKIKRGAQVGSLDDSGNFVPGSAPSSNTAGSSAVNSVGPRNDAPVPGTVAAGDTRPRCRQSVAVRASFTQWTRLDPGDRQADAWRRDADGADRRSPSLNNTKNTAQAKVDRRRAPERTALSGMQAPMARNVSPMGGAMLPNVGQTYGQTR